ncbi:histone deacetylase family protein [Thalassotalea mangrovi]|uniref:Histone deacetylase n=1 Tax=Thalassotalea mangrovi TaxID=2572245 RepID=A0A4U1B6B7_9GAMM|nr:histone deacetylase [Thalassotalea mangrovi]TKB45692.1 histone deacetylase [Thalassotalea mangrovi]
MKSFNIPLVFHPIYSQLDLPERHRFPIDKYHSIFKRLLNEGVSENVFHLPEMLAYDRASPLIDAAYIDALVSNSLDHKAMRRIGFPWSEQLIKRTFTAVGGTLLTAELAYTHGIAINLTGGYHHAFTDFGSGFCMINDLYLAANRLLEREDINRVLIFDCDVHQGDGTAALAQGRDDIITVSLHCEKNFPYRKQDSDMDFPLDKHLDDAEYLQTVEQALLLALNCYHVDAVIYDAGVDVHQDDDLGHLNITTKGVYLRDKLVFAACKQRGLPVAAVIGGGYQRDIEALTDVHLQLFKAAYDVYTSNNG